MSSHRRTVFAVLLFFTVALLVLTSSVWAVASYNGSTMHETYLPFVQAPTAVDPGDAILEAIKYGQAHDHMGSDVAIDGNIAVVGAPDADRPYSGSHDSDTGVAHIFTRTSSGSWVKVKELWSPDIEIGAEFGRTVALDGDLAAVYAYHGSGGILYQGVIYLYERDRGGPDNWGYVTTVTAPDPAHLDLFGNSMTLQGDLLVASSLHADQSGDTDAGAVYIFERNRGGPDNWGLVKKLVADDGRDYGKFGRTLALDGDILVVNSDIGDDLDSPTTYVFKRDHGGPDNWGQVQKFTGSGANLGDHFGWSIALSGDLLALGAYWTTVGTNEEQGNLYIFHAQNDNRTQWDEVAILTAPDGQAREEFGRAVTINGDLLAVGAPYAQIGDNPRQGAAYLYLPRDGDLSQWDMTRKLTADPQNNAGSFAFSLASSGSTLVATWPSTVPDGTGHGAAYFYRTAIP